LKTLADIRKGFAAFFALIGVFFRICATKAETQEDEGKR
jgi:hypothetical protein